MNLKDKYVLVTGGNGFLGKHVREVLEKRGARVLVYSSEQYDLNEMSEVRHMFSNRMPDVVIHLAAKVGGIGANRKSPADFLHENLLMGLNVIEASVIFGIEKLVMVGTVCSYPKFTPVPFNESALWDGYPEETNAPYGIAKKTLGVLVDAYRRQYGFNGVYVIPVNLYGPGDNIDLESSHVIPAMMRKMLTAKANRDRSVRLWGDGTPTREFLYVKDAAEGIVRSAEDLETSEPVNLGSGEEISMKSLAQLIKDLSNYNGNLIWDLSQPNGQPRRCLDTSKAKQLIAWKASTTLFNGLTVTLNDIRTRLGLVEKSTSDGHHGSGR